MYRGGERSLVRELNLSSVLRWLHTAGPLSRAQISQKSGLNKSTVSSLVAELLEAGLIHEMGIDASGAGRPATLLSLKAEAGWVIGLELGVDFMAAVVADFTGSVHWQHRHPIDPSQSQETVLAQMLALADQAFAVVRRQQGRLLGCGIALPGMVDVNTGALRFSPNLQWRDVPVGQLFAQRFDVPIFVDNDANAAAVGEHLFGGALHTRHFVFVVGGVGIGGGLFLNGEVYRGGGGMAGEIGHTIVTHERGRPCRCGSRSCWETMGNQYAIVEMARGRLEVGRHSLMADLLAAQAAPLSLDIIVQAAQEGDAEACEVLNEAGAAIGLGVANLINIFNPDLVVFGGPLCAAGDILLPAIRASAARHALPETMQTAEIVLSAFGPQANVIGAVALVVYSILTHPTAVVRSKTG